MLDDNDILEEPTTDTPTTEDPNIGGQTNSDDSTNDNQTTDTSNEGQQPTTPINLTETLHINSIPVNIPIEYLFVYNKLLLVMVELGESMLHSCKSLCDTKNMPVVECYHMFQAALAARQLSVTDGIGVSNNYYAKVANTLLNYVKAQLNCIVENYKDSISFTIPYAPDGSVNLFITIEGDNTQVIIEPSDTNPIDELIDTVNTLHVLDGFVVTSDSEDNYGLTQEEIDSHIYWHVYPGSEFVPGTLVVHINGVLYIVDDDDYEEWIVTENGVSTGVGFILRTGYFDVGEKPDEIYVEGDLISDNDSN